MARKLDQAGPGGGRGAIAVPLGGVRRLVRLGGIPTLPSSLEEALNDLENDCQFLLKGGVFSEDLVQAWIDYKRGNEVDALRIRPHPHEFFMCYDV